MIIYADYKKNFYDSTTTWGKYDSDTGAYCEYAPEDMPVEIATEVTGAIVTTEIYVQHLDFYYKDIMKSLYFAGCTPVTGNPKLKEMRANSFKYLIGDNGVCYHITAKIRGKKVQILNASALTMVKDRGRIVEAFGNKDDSVRGYTLGTFLAISGLITGTTAKSRPLTMGGAAKKDWQRMMGFWELKGMLKDCNKQHYDKKHSLEEFIRPSYHGGICLYDEDKTAQETGSGYSIDCNSLYPYVMSKYPMPYGVGHAFKGEPTHEVKRNAEYGIICYFVKFVAKFTLKPGGIPCVRVDNTRQMLYHESGWMTTSDHYNGLNGTYSKNDKGVELTLTHVDFKLFCENYDFEILKWMGGVWFPSTVNLFCDYVYKWYKVKEEADTPAIRKISKLFLNTLSGKMAVWPEVYNIKISIDEDGEVKEDREKSKTKPASYVHIGSFITSYARKILIHMIKCNRSRWLYSDTDSLHLLGNEPPVGCVIGSGLGEWKVEKSFDKAYYYDRKQYAMVKDGKANFTIAGRTSYAVDYIEKAYEADGDYLKFKYARSMSKLQLEALYRKNNGEADDGDEEVIADMYKKQPGEELVQNFKTLGLSAPLYYKAEEYIRIGGEPFNMKFEKIYISLKE